MVQKLSLMAMLVVSLTAMGAEPSRSALEGYWKAQSVIVDDQEQFPNEKERAALTLVVKEGEYRMYFRTSAEKDEHMRLFTAEYTLEESTQGIELTVKDGRQKGKKMHGLYELKNGLFRVCYCPVDKPRPTRFEAPKGSGCFLETWVPEKK